MSNQDASLISPSSLPPSCTASWVNFTGFCGFLVAVFILRRVEGLDIAAAMLISLMAIAVPMMVLELWRRCSFQRTSSGLDFSAQPDVNLTRVAVKLLGFYLTIGVVALLYWLLKDYHSGFYQGFWVVLEMALPVFLIAALPYFLWIDRYLKQPKDGYWQAGMFFLGRWRELDRAMLGQYALGWLVKAFYIPLMLVMFSQSLTYLLHADFNEVFSGAQPLYVFFFECSFLIDLLYACIGYALTVRLLDSHIRSTEPTMRGWVFALICYEPFWTITYGTYLTYNSDNYNWGNWLEAEPKLYAIWATLIILLLVIYAASSATFGLRFSNLTHRGVLTNGPYRYCKHPAYVAKNITWWLIAVPFIVDSTAWDAVRDSVLLLGVNYIYFMRARTEERHMSWDPVYRQYAMAMNERSIFSGLAKRLTFLRYKEPEQPHPLAWLDQA